jgi:trehalose 6-phosphate phosphatase
MTLPAPLEQALAQVARSSSLLVATDFDGVLAPLVLDPLKSRPLPGTIESLQTLATLPRTHAAVVSGRDLATLTTLTGLADSEVTRIGSHGAETSADGAGAADLGQPETQRLEALVTDLAALAAAHPGTTLEHKPAAVVLHTRGMEPGAAAAAEAAARELAERHTEVHVTRGKHVVEMSVVRADKGTALMAVRAAVGAHAVVYFGDDVTDEDVFTVLSATDVGVKVGDGATAATYRVAEPEQAAEALSLLTRIRQDV